MILIKPGRNISDLDSSGSLESCHVRIFSQRFKPVSFEAANQQSISGLELVIKGLVEMPELEEILCKVNCNPLKNSEIREEQSDNGPACA